MRQYFCLKESKLFKMLLLMTKNCISHFKKMVFLILKVTKLLKKKKISYIKSQGIPYLVLPSVFPYFSSSCGSAKSEITSANVYRL